MVQNGKEVEILKKGKKDLKDQAQKPHIRLTGVAGGKQGNGRQVVIKEIT